MSLLPRGRGARIRWLGWTVFWAVFCYLGQEQAWVFGEEEKPALAGAIEPLHFWFPTLLIMAPLLPLFSLLLRAVPPESFALINILEWAVWIVLWSRAIVLVQDRLHPEAGPLITWGRSC